jgi:hypothetical protein
VLAGVDECLLDSGSSRERPENGGDFHEIRAGTHYVKDMHEVQADITNTAMLASI